MDFVYIRKKALKNIKTNRWVKITKKKETGNLKKKEMKNKRKKAEKKKSKKIR